MRLRNTQTTDIFTTLMGSRTLPHVSPIAKAPGSG